MIKRWASLLLCVAAFTARAATPEETAATLVVYNSSDPTSTSLAPRLRLIQAGALAVVAILILSPWDLGDILIAFLLAAAFAVDGVTRMVTAWYVRFPGWRVYLASGALLLGLATLVSWFLIALPRRRARWRAKTRCKNSSCRWRALQCHP